MRVMRAMEWIRRHTSRTDGNIDCDKCVTSHNHAQHDDMPNCLGTCRNDDKSRYCVPYLVLVGSVNANIEHCILFGDIAYCMLLAMMAG